MDFLTLPFTTDFSSIAGTVFILFGILWPSEFSNLALWLESTGDAESYNKYLIQILRFFDLKSLFIVFGNAFNQDLGFEQTRLFLTNKCFQFFRKHLFRIKMRPFH